MLLFFILIFIDIIIKFITARLLNDAGGYKYLGDTENRGSNIARESFEKVKKEMIIRVYRLCDSNLNKKNLFKAINEHAFPLINYHIGPQHLEPADFAAIVQEVPLPNKAQRASQAWV
ncbi:hypothetical protein TCON_2450 [Astathelohania contejeani]|uniref:LAGLIDADG homing endonuclease n=1 Tax=Astathelohania contejeani TaxID=164912 RepID=A0ABQ7HW32_9MICR|nr:hypothetical protein TCON_2450 [Thelohania contejeani]